MLKPHVSIALADVHAPRAERQAEFRLQHLSDARAHEIDDGLRRVDDAVRVGDLDRVALEETLGPAAPGAAVRTLTWPCPETSPGKWTRPRHSSGRARGGAPAGERGCQSPAQLGGPARSFHSVHLVPREAPWLRRDDSLFGHAGPRRLRFRHTTMKLYRGRFDWRTHEMKNASGAHTRGVEQGSQARKAVISSALQPSGSSRNAAGPPSTRW
jgi:hypothetical protein